MSSAPELEALAVKAAKAKGLSAGNAEDLARAAVWLSARGHGGLEALLAMDRLQPSDPSAGRGPGDRSVGRVGPAAVDLAAASPAGSEIRVGPLDAGVLLFGLCGVAAARRGLSFVMADGSGRRHIVDGEACRPPPVDDADRHVISCRAEGTGDRSEPSHRPGDPIAVEASVWDRINRLAAETHVPSNEQSRHRGAGAGLTDND